MLERLNQGSSGTHVVRIPAFAEHAPQIRKLPAPRAGAHENWLESPRYPNMDHLSEH
jgi:hypothetical protein